ncbi:hypothetical protein LQ384_23235 [Rhodococcus rhodochrous]|uniref:Uncharacterized protein n=1 Tax=Rhodococcus rhodochrous TaxID=1829 RepID=A0AAW4XM27_RHORH|nr:MULTISPECIES: hypothetical protein [Rhodococcus]MBX4171494.1 hypothetical protein [Rhodococcus sp. DMU2021]MCD2114033.1 hypothetical protein [Rhodococcus rhodochrous]
MATTVGSHSAVDGILILESVRKFLASDVSGDSLDGENADTCEYIDDIISAIKADAGITDGELDTARAWGGREWTGALVRGLFGMERIEELRSRNAL